MRPGAGTPVPDPEVVEELLAQHLPEGRLSIAVFGPGEGEAVVVRLPDGSVGVVDGCREPNGDDDGYGDPVRELLSKVEASVDRDAFRLGFVCLTHPHADHYRGLGKLIEAYSGKIDRLWKVALTPKYEQTLETWLSIIYTDNIPDRADYLGLKRVFHRFHEEQPLVQNCNPPGFSHLSQRKLLLRRTLDGHPLCIEACGPADGDLEDAQKQLMAILKETAADGKKVSRSHDPNLVSGALLIRWGQSAVLLAGDLLRGEVPSSGWQLAREQVDFRVQVVNVAHHASVGAHDDQLWAVMQPALALVTPFKHGMSPNPPRPAQIATLAQSAVVVITSPPEWNEEEEQPAGMRVVRARDFKAKNGALKVATKDAHDARRNAVAVNLDAAGNITRLILAGNADVYG
jgi:beta-lactamase superfamily II metal-dependent hydrolase